MRRRRLELGLFQKEVADFIGVTPSTVWNWEHGWIVDLKRIPIVIEFLGYNSFLRPSDTLKQLPWHKKINGLSFDQLGKRIGRDPEQLSDWLSGRHTVNKKNKEKIAEFLEVVS